MDTKRLQQMLDKGGDVYVADGNYVISDTLLIHDNTHLSLGANAVIRLADNANCVMLQNELCSVGINRNITVTGGTWDGNNAAQTKGKPFFMCEYAHAMGNAIGNFKEYWDAFYSSDSLIGGCIWDWVDQALWKYTDRFDESGKRIRYLAFGGDFDEYPNDGPFCCNGVIRPDRKPTAKLIEVAHVHRNVKVSVCEEIP